MELAGIPVMSDGEPVTPTIVFAPDRTLFNAFCQAARVNPRSPRVRFAGQFDKAKTLRGMSSSDGFRHIVFLVIDPRVYRCNLLLAGDETFYTLESLRSMGSFDRAFFYPETANIRPDFADGSPEGRGW
jgi:hypothetical protein